MGEAKKAASEVAEARAREELVASIVGVTARFVESGHVKGTLSPAEKLTEKGRSRQEYP
jgi:hypothetical protein